MFDPNRQEPDGPAVTAGERLIVITWSKNKETKKGKLATRLSCKVIAGQEKGATFYTTIGRDTSLKGNYVRWKALCEYAAIDTAIDLDDDATVARCFHQVPFKADLSIETNGKYTDVNLQRICYARLLTDEDRAAIEEWHAEQETGGSSGDEAPPHDDEEAPAGNRTFREDDIPF